MHQFAKTLDFITINNWKIELTSALNNVFADWNPLLIQEISEPLHPFEPASWPNLLRMTKCWGSGQKVTMWLGLTRGIAPNSSISKLKTEFLVLWYFSLDWNSFEWILHASQSVLLSILNFQNPPISAS